MSLLLMVGLAAEVIFTIMLFNWRRTLDHDIAEHRRECYACITGAGVTSFNSDHRLCNEHRAHWWLIRDLEDQVRD